MANAAKPSIILFCYPGSPWSLKVSTYLLLRNIPFSECRQPMTWPRPDLQQLGITYRRIPVLAIGKDIYCDTSLILETLETLYPKGSLSHPKAEGKALETLLEHWSQTALMKTIPALMPSAMPLLQDPSFITDRKKLWGIEFSSESIERGRPGALTELNLHLKTLEGLLSDGRQWVAGTSEMSLADIHVAFFFDWANMVPGALPDDFAVSTQHSNARRYLQDYFAYITNVRTTAGSVPNLTGREAICLIQASACAQLEETVECHSGLSKDQKVVVCRTDDISGHRSIGTLQHLSPLKSVIAVGEDSEVYVHSPRMNFSVSPVSGKEEL